MPNLRPGQTGEIPDFGTFSNMCFRSNAETVLFSCYDGGRWTPAFGNGYERENRIETNLSDLRRQLAPLQAGE